MNTIDTLKIIVAMVMAAIPVSGLVIFDIVQFWGQTITSVVLTSLVQLFFIALAIYLVCTLYEEYHRY